MPYNYPLRFRHRYVIGQTGTGKSTYLANEILSDIVRGDGVLVLDPHGELIDSTLDRFPKSRRPDAIIYDPSDADRPVPWNPMSNVTVKDRPRVAKAMLDSFKANWDYGRVPVPNIDLTVYNATYALLDVPDGTLLGMFLMLVSKTYRASVLAHVKDPVVKRYFEYVEKEVPGKEQRERTGSTLNKIEMLMADPYIRNSLGQPQSAFDLRDIMDTGKCLFVRLPQGPLGLETARTIGSLILTQAHNAALNRKTARPFHIYLDEVHHFATPTLREMLSGIRKFSVSLTLAHQHLGQLDDEMRGAILGNVGTRIMFRLGMEDAEFLGRSMPYDNTAPLLHELPPYQARVMTPDSLTTEAFPPLPEITDPNMRERLTKASRTKYGKRVDHVEEHIGRFLE